MLKLTHKQETNRAIVKRGGLFVDVGNSCCFVSFDGCSVLLF
nr:MAG TPA: hypothetical protein [Herelleviridae sp.]